MHPTHVIDFVDFKLKQYQEKHDTSYAKYLEYKAEYDAKWYNKLVGSKYTGMWDFWDWFRYSHWIDELNEIRREAVYKSKMEYTVMTIDSKWHTHFYKWAQENNIPY